MSQQLYIQVRIQAETKAGVYQDAIYYPKEDWDSGKVNQDTIDAEVKRRCDIWESRLTDQSIPPPSPNVMQPFDVHSKVQDIG